MCSLNKSSICVKKHTEVYSHRQIVFGKIEVNNDIRISNEINNFYK